MNNPQAMELEDILEYCLDMIERGASTQDCIAQFPAYANELREMLSLVSELNTINTPLMTRSQVQSIQNNILSRIDVPSSWWERLVPRPSVFMAVTAVVVVIIIAGIIFILNNDDPPSEMATVLVSVSPENDDSDETLTVVALDPTLVPTENATDTEVPPSKTATTEPTASDTPTVEPSATDTATVLPTEEPDETAALPVYIDYGGQVRGIDGGNGRIEIDGVSITLDEETLQTITFGEYVLVSGLLDDNGLLAADIVEETTADANEQNFEDCEFNQQEEPDRICHPVMLILSDAFQVPYDELDALHNDGFGIGEISRLYLLAEEAETDVAEIIQMRANGLSWAEIIAQFPALPADDLALGIIIGNGQGQTIRTDTGGARIYSPNASSGNQTGNNTDVPTQVPTQVATSVPPVSNPPDRVTICHNGNTITVAWEAWVNSHSQHGDTLGPCE